MKKFLLLIALSLPILASAQRYNLMPYPKSVSQQRGQFDIDKKIEFVLSGDYSSNTKAYFQRFINRLNNRSAAFFDNVAITHTAIGRYIEVSSSKKSELNNKLIRS